MCQLYQNSLEDDVFTLNGVTSWGKVPCGKAKQPTVYTRVKSYTGWIVSNIQLRDPTAGNISWEVVGWGCVWCRIIQKLLSTQ